MTLKELKEQIKINSFGDDFIVFVNEGNQFLVNQYIEAICKIKNCNKIEVQSIYEPLTSASALVMDFENNLSVLYIDTFEERAEDYSIFTNTIVVCKKVDKSLEKALEHFIVKIPVLQDWQVFDYVRLLCPTLSDQDISWLIDIVKSGFDDRHPESYKDKNGDIYRILNELDKILLFPLEQQAELFNRIRYDSETDLYRIGFFQLTNAIFQFNYTALFEYLRHAKALSIDPIGVANTLLINYKNLACVLGGTAAQIGLTSKQAYAIQKNTPIGLTMPKIERAIKFLSNIDLDLKSSKLDMSSDRIFDYIFAHLVAIYRQDIR